MNSLLRVSVIALPRLAWAFIWVLLLPAVAVVSQTTTDTRCTTNGNSTDCKSTAPETNEEILRKGTIVSGNIETAIVNSGATPYIPFKATATGKGSDLWKKLWHYYEYNRQDFLASYHKRSNVETTFSMIKTKFGAAVRSKTPNAQMNEVLCKVLCHNLSVLVHSIYDLGVEPVFWGDQEKMAA